MMSPSLKLAGYHLHVYCTVEQMDLATAVRESLLKALPCVEGAGPVRNRPIGPHPLPMFEAWFQPEAIAEILPWILRNRNGLSVLIHPMTGDDLADHTQNAIWIGDKLTLNLDVFNG